MATTTAAELVSATHYVTYHHAEKMGEVVRAVIQNYGNGAQVIKVPKMRWPDLATRYAWPEVEAALSTARASASRLAPRSAKAFEEYATVVSSEGWFADACQQVWNSPREHPSSKSDF